MPVAASYRKAPPVTNSTSAQDLPQHDGVVAQPIRIRPAWRTWYVATLLILDLAIGFISATAAFTLRFGPAADGPYKDNYALLSCVLPLAWITSLAANRAYEMRRLFVGNDEYDRVIRSALALLATLAVLAYSFDVRLARGYLVIAVPMAAACDILARYLLRKRLHRRWGHGELLNRVILVGHEQSVRQTTRRLSQERHHGLGVVGACLPVAETNTSTPYRASPTLPPIYGNFDQVAQAVTRTEADTVIVLSCPEIDGAAVRRLAWQLERDDIDLVVASSLIDVAGYRTTIRPVDGLPLLHVEHAYLKGIRRLVKDVTDRLGAMALLAMAAVPILAIALTVRLASGDRGPVIFRQVRVGKGGQPFQMYKFRTMYGDAETRLAQLRCRNDTDGALFKMRHDPRITPIGRFLRRWSLDELPQLLNILNGDMSIVGPRPPLPAEVAQYPDDMRRRLVVKPGLTGLWQVSGRADLSWEDAVRLDLSYVENWSLTMDLTIMARTLIVVLRQSGAY